MHVQLFNTKFSIYHLVLADERASKQHALCRQLCQLHQRGDMRPVGLGPTAHQPGRVCLQWLDWSLRLGNAGPLASDSLTLNGPGDEAPYLELLNRDRSPHVSRMLVNSKLLQGQYTWQ